MKYRNFKEKEVVGLVINFVMLLDDARDLAKVPFIITSGFRDPAGNAEAGGVNNSAHLRGLAVDLKCTNSGTRYLIINSLLKTGFHRIGVYSDHIHVDMDATLPKNMIWQE